MNFGQLEYFVAVCEEKSISAAAKKTYMSQQSVSASISSLEKELGVSLLVRSQKGVYPTEAGEAVLARAREILGSLQDMEHEALQAHEEVLDNVMLAYLPDIFDHYNSSTFFRKTVDSFSKANPSVNLHTLSANSDICINLVRDGTADLGLITAQTQAAPEGLDALEVVRTSLLLYVPKNHPLSEKPMVHISDLRETKIATSSMRDFSLYAYINKCSEYGIAPLLSNGGLSINEYYKYLVQNNEIGFMLDTNQLISANPSHIAVPFAPEDRIDISGLAIFRKDSLHDPGCRLLLRHLKETFNTDPT